MREMYQVIRILFKCAIATFSITMMLLALSYTVQSRETREKTPTQIGQGTTEKPFLVEFTETRQELIIGYLRETFPTLHLPEPKAEPVNPLGLQALQERARISRARQAAQKPKVRRPNTRSTQRSEERPKLRVLKTSP